MNSPTKCHGGKHYLAQKIIALMPSRKTWHLYREPYAGAMSVLFGLNPEGLSEAVNDLNGDLTCFWQAMANPVEFEVLRRILEGTPLCESAWIAAEAAKRQSIAWRAADYFVRIRQSRQALGKSFVTPTVRLRRGMNEQVSAWLSAIEGLPEIHARMRRVEVRQMDGVKFIRAYDHKQAVFYCDPPYMPETRTAKKAYGEFEMTVEEHIKLLETLAGIKGRFLLSGYRTRTYDLFAADVGWRRVDFTIDNKASSAKTKATKTESVWMNYK